MNRLFLILLVGALACVSSVAAQTPAELCATVKSIKELPRDPGEKGIDATYDKIVAAGDSVVPCLIDSITKVEVMRDPRCPTISTATTIGDVSYFLLVDILKLEFTELFPADVRANFKTNGVYAYHEYIDRKDARKELQKKLRKWYAVNKGKQS